MSKTSPGTALAPRRHLRHECAEPSCAVSHDNLLRCNDCNLVRYCCLEHQASHRPEHKALCDEAKTRGGKWFTETCKVIKMVPCPLQDFSHLFWQPPLNSYQRAGLNLIEVSRTAATIDGMQEALRLCRELHEIDIHDRLSLRAFMPALTMRLGRDKECFHFVQYLPTSVFQITPAPNFAQGTIPVAKLAAMGTDTIAAILLIKLKILVDIRNLKVTRKILSTTLLPPELCEPIELAVVRNEESRYLVKMSFKELIHTEQAIINYAEKLGSALNEACGTFFTMIFRPEQASKMKKPELQHFTWRTLTPSRSPGPCNHKEDHLFHQTFPAFWEAEGVLELLQKARECAALQAADGVDSFAIYRGPDTSSHEGQDADYERPAVTVNLEKVWRYLGKGLQRWSYLGKPATSDLLRGLQDVSVSKPGDG